jgi:hypothetical protein
MSGSQGYQMLDDAQDAKAIILTEKRNKLIPLTQGKFAQVDCEDYAKVIQYKWYAHKHGKTFYARRNVRVGKNQQSNIKMHHFLFGKPPDGYEYDHLDGNGLNNQRANILLKTHRQNCQNRHISKASKYPGISWFKRTKQWIAQIQINGVNMGLGYFPTEESAYDAYKKAVEKNGEVLA